jgi:hypothetical protein
MIYNFIIGKIGITGIDIAFAQPFYRSKVLLRNYGTYLRAVEKQDLLKQCLSTFLSLCPLFVRSLQYDNPLEFPLKS